MGYPSDCMGTLGILGGGQLARMTALAARELGFRVHALDPARDCPVSPLVDRLIVAPCTDVAAARTLAASCEVVTVDHEHVPAPVLRALEEVTKVHPGSGVLEVIQDRGRQKTWLHERGFPVGPFRVAEGADALRSALTDLGGRCFVKACQGGFDGRGQARASADSDPHAVLRDIGSERVSVEAALAFKVELSVLVARRPSGDVLAYPAALNHHEHGILVHSLLPAPLPEAIVARAQTLAMDVAAALGVSGLCAVEMFLMPDGSLWINELAPRPHNSYHGSGRAVETSQFEQHVRAVFDLPLGPVGVVRPTAMATLLGDLWLGNAAPNLRQALEIPGVHVQLYGKSDPRPGRKVGHLSAIGDDVHQALERVILARDALRKPGTARVATPT